MSNVCVDRPLMQVAVTGKQFLSLGGEMFRDEWRGGLWVHDSRSVRGMRLRLWEGPAGLRDSVCDVCSNCRADLQLRRAQGDQ